MFPTDSTSAYIMACTPTTVYVSIDREKIKALIKEKLDAALHAAAGAFPHINKDKNYSPSEWWFDRERTIRHTLATTGDLAYDDTTSVLTLTLTYEVREK